jgi:catechol 2,3-dioxygenase-like lactoylglutathione lyase family enzyme
MKIEHVALNVPHPQAMSDWYEKHLGLKVVRKMAEPPYMTFLADESGKVMVELYHNEQAPVLEFDNLSPLVVHLAFVSQDPDTDKNRLISNGAVEVSDDTLPDGSRLVMLRDPWGFALQLCKRANPMLS